MNIKEKDLRPGFAFVSPVTHAKYVVKGKNTGLLLIERFPAMRRDYPQSKPEGPFALPVNAVLAILNAPHLQTSN